MDLLTCIYSPQQNQTAPPPRQFLACRTFSEKYKGEIEDSEMETIALEGHFPLCPAVYHTYLPAELPYEMRND